MKFLIRCIVTWLWKIQWLSFLFGKNIAKSAILNLVTNLQFLYIVVHFILFGEEELRLFW